MTANECPPPGSRIKKLRVPTSSQLSKPQSQRDPIFVLALSIARKHECSPGNKHQHVLV